MRTLRNFLILSVLAVAAAFGQSGLLTYPFQAPVPPPVTNASGAVSGTQGRTMYYYWVVARYPSGSVPPVVPVIVPASNDTLSVPNFNVISWNTVPNATGYDVLRSTTPNFPAGGTNLVTGCSNVASGPCNDQSNTLSAYTFTPATVANLFLQINNRDFSTPAVAILDASGNAISTFQSGSGGTGGQIINGIKITDSTGADLNGVYSVEGTVTLAQTNASLTLVAASTARTLKVVGFWLKVTGAFATCTDVRLSDTAGSPVDVVTLPIAGLTNGAVITEGTTANVTLGTFAIGLTASQGLQVRQTGAACTGNTSVQWRVYYKVNS